MEASTAPTRPPRPEPEEREDREGVEAVRAAGQKDKLSDGEKQNALEWFLADDDASFTHTMELNVGTPKAPQWIEWEMRPVDLDTLRRIRKQAAGNRNARRSGSGEIDEVEANLRIVVEGTVSPDLKEIAKQKRIADPADALRLRFARKPGLLGQIAGEIMGISGYDDDDVREVEAGKP